MRRFARWFTDPHRQRRIHGVSVLISIALAAPIMIWFRSSVPILMAVSLWTWIAGNAAPWLAAMAADETVTEP